MACRRHHRTELCQQDDSSCPRLSGIARGTNQPKSGTSHKEMGPSTSIISQESAPQACLQANQLGAFLQLSFSLPK